MENKAAKSLLWVCNQIPDDLGDSNEDRMLKCIKLYCKQGAKEIKTLDLKAKLFKVVTDYYDNLDSLAKRLQDDYSGDKPFVQQEEDRLGLCFILDFFDDLKAELAEV